MTIRIKIFNKIQNIYNNLESQCTIEKLLLSFDINHAKNSTLDITLNNTYH